MSRYIDADGFAKSIELSIKSWGRDCNSNAPKMVLAYQDVLHRLQNAPTADVVEVVRCKDCKYNHFVQPNGTIHCHKELHCKFVKPTDFCSEGERREQ